MRRAMQSVFLSLVFLFALNAIAILLEGVQSAINGFGLFQGLMGGTALALARALSVQIPISAVLSFSIFFVFKITGFRQSILIFLLALVPAASLMAHFAIRDLEFEAYLGLYAMSFSGPVRGLGVGFILVFSSLISAFLVVRFQEKLAD